MRPISALAAALFALTLQMGSAQAEDKVPVQAQEQAPVAAPLNMPLDAAVSAIEPAAGIKPAANPAAATAANAATTGSEAPLPPTFDVDEALPLPPYPMGARIAIGAMQTYKTGEEDTLLDVARQFDLGYVQLRAANPDIDPWAPEPGQDIVIPSFHLLPRARQTGIVVNLAEMRLYHFRKPGAEPDTYALGIGKDGLQTPTGETTIVRKAAYPSWFPTARMREEKPWLPVSVAPGAANPLGTHALYLGWPTFLIHGSNKPWAIGRRVSSGCMRMYPEDIIRVFENVPVGTKVTVVDQPILIGWVDDKLYLSANPSRLQSNQIEIDGLLVPKSIPDGLKQNISAAAGPAAKDIDWHLVEKVLTERRGYPVEIASGTPPAPVVMPAIDEKKKTADAAPKALRSPSGKLN
jgi:L,D-transpeptidase ErfK/SrfK